MGAEERVGTKKGKDTESMEKEGETELKNIRKKGKAVGKKTTHTQIKNKTKKQ